MPSWTPRLPISFASGASSTGPQASRVSGRRSCLGSGRFISLARIEALASSACITAQAALQPPLAAARHRPPPPPALLQPPCPASTPPQDPESWPVARLQVVDHLDEHGALAHDAAHAVDIRNCSCRSVTPGAPPCAGPALISPAAAAALGIRGTKVFLGLAEGSDCILTVSVCDDPAVVGDGEIAATPVQRHNLHLAAGTPDEFRWVGSMFKTGGRCSNRQRRGRGAGQPRETPALPAAASSASHSRLPSFLPQGVCPSRRPAL